MQSLLWLGSTTAALFVGLDLEGADAGKVLESTYWEREAGSA